MKIFFLVLFTFSTCIAFAQSDETGCKDHPFFTRMPGFFISGCSGNYNEYELVVGNDKKQTVEGSIITNSYYIKNGVEMLPSPFQIMKTMRMLFWPMAGKGFICQVNTTMPDLLVGPLK